jgi:hypothetical protein
MEMQMKLMYPGGNFTIMYRYRPIQTALLPASFEQKAAGRGGRPAASLSFLVLMALLAGACSAPELNETETLPTPYASPLANTPTMEQMSLPVGMLTGAGATLAPTATRAGATAALPTCTYSHYYWGQNPDRWLTDNFVIGEQVLNKDQVLELLALETPIIREALLQQLLAVFLNSLAGVDAREVEVDVLLATRWLATYSNRLGLTAAETNEGLLLVENLSAFNLGETGPGNCADEPPTPTPLPETEKTAAPTPTAAQARLPSPAPGSSSSPTPLPSSPTLAPPTASPTIIATAAPTATSTPAPTPTATPWRPGVIPILPTPRP